MAILGIQGLNVVTARALSAADDGSYPYTVSAMQNGVTITFSGTINIIPAPPPPPTPTGLAVTPNPASVVDNAPVGTVVSSAAVTTSDGSPFTGTLSVTGPA